jgi:hypothetical protein
VSTCPRWCTTSTCGRPSSFRHPGTLGG